jgi:hypothetical protein
MMEDDLLDKLSRFSASSEDDKLERFEQSTIALVLKQLGADAGIIKRYQRDLELEFNCSWFNSLALVEPEVATTRFFRFNMNELFEKPHKSPVVEEYLKRIAGTSSPYILVFKAYDYGRMVITNLKLPKTTHIHVVAGGTSGNVALFNGFFTTLFGQSAEELS